MSNSTLPLEDSPFLLDEHGPVFILGCPRSGTTFLSECLGLIDDVEEFVGVLAPPRLMHYIGYLHAHGSDVSALLACVREVFWQAFWRRRLFPSERLARRLATRRFFWKLLSKPTVESALFCYKEPFLCFAIESFVQEFPQAKFIHIIRDGRDNADSLERMYPDALSDQVLQSVFLAQNKNCEIGNFSQRGDWLIPWWVPERDAGTFISASRYGRCVWMWREMVERASRAKTMAGEDRFLELSYEEFVANPVGQSERISSFLGRPLSHSAKRAFSKSHTKSIGIGQRRQVGSRMEEAESIAGDLLRQLNYR